MEPEFRQHCTRTFSQSGLSYDQCSPAYRYGYELAGNKKYRGDWAMIEADARRDWEQRIRARGSASRPPFATHGTAPAVRPRPHKEDTRPAEEVEGVSGATANPFPNRCRLPESDAGH